MTLLIKPTTTKVRCQAFWSSQTKDVLTHPLTTAPFWQTPTQPCAPRAPLHKPGGSPAHRAQPCRSQMPRSKTCHVGQGNAMQVSCATYHVARTGRAGRKPASISRQVAWQMRGQDLELSKHGMETVHFLLSLRGST